MKKFILSYIILLTGIISGCSKNDSGEIITHQYKATIHVTVSQADSVLSGAKVDVYENKDDRDNVLQPDYSKTTDLTGVAEFGNLDTSYYYLRVTNPKTQAVIKDETNTPDGTISFVEIIF
ncbi:MAG TPA: hypothetical protein VE978_11810 [Chitinophagales bacterium]|nr:hypothetical protein [Chitinophagales bacterium]